jgi:small-conductance mechanosensitive channel
MRSKLRLLSLVVLLQFPFVATAQPADAQNAPAPATPTRIQSLTPSERIELLSKLSDQQARELLAEYLKATPPSVPQTRADPIRGMEAESARFRENFIAVMKSAPHLREVPSLVYDRLTEGRGPMQPVAVLAFLAAVIGLGYAIEYAARRMSRPLRGRLAAIGPDSDFLARFGRAVGLLLLDMAGLALFASTAVVLFLVMYQGHGPTRLTVLTVLSAFFLFRFIGIFSRAIFGIGRAQIRLITVEDDDARMAHRYVLAAAAIGSFGFLGRDLLQMFGLDAATSGLITFIVGTLFVLSVSIGVWRLRRPIADAILSPVPSRQHVPLLLSITARFWHVPVLLYLLLVYVFAVYNGFLGYISGRSAVVASILLIAALPILDRLLCSAVDRYFGTGGNPNRTLYRSMHFLVVLIGVAALAAIWNINPLEVAGEGMGARATRALFNILMTGLVAYIAWGFLTSAIARHMPAQIEPETLAEGAVAEGTTRAATVLPIFMRFIQITLAVIVVMIALSALGVNIGPLLAGAGVIGLAVGFGAQTLVRDLVSGLFFLVDDAFRIGEYVDLGGIRGTVERINLRSVVLRHHLGPLNTVPYGEIQHLTNYSRDWVIMKLEFRVGYSTDMDKVKKIFKRIGQEMLDDPELGKDFIQPFKSQGVKAMEEMGMLVRGKFMAKPGTQFQIRKELYSRIQKAFLENGIEFAQPRVMVALPPDADQPSERKEEIAGAAAAASAALARKKRETSGR